VITFEQMTLLHRHGDDWQELRPEHNSPDDHDVERRILRGAKLYRCSECDLEILAVPPEGT
jgi:hypothetical protein